MRVQYKDEMFEVEYAKIEDMCVSVGRNEEDIVFEVHCDDDFAADTLFYALGANPYVILTNYGTVKDLRSETQQFSLWIDCPKDQTRKMLESMRDEFGINFLLNV